MTDMEVRWFTTCDKNGVWSEPRLQYWNGDYWEDVLTVTCKTWEEEEYLGRR